MQVRASYRQIRYQWKAQIFPLIRYVVKLQLSKIATAIVDMFGYYNRYPTLCSTVREVLPALSPECLVLGSCIGCHLFPPELFLFLGLAVGAIWSCHIVINVKHDQWPA